MHPTTSSELNFGSPQAETVRLSGHDNLQLSADLFGDANAPPVLMLHGAGQTRHSWRRGAAELAHAGFHVISVDHRGHGDSQWSDTGDYSLNAISGDVRAIARAQNKPVALVGASLGGVASMLALGEPAPDSAGPPPAYALVLVDVVARMAREGVARIHGFMGAQPDGFTSLEEAADAIASYLPHRPRPSSLDGLRKNLRQGSDGRWRWHWDPAFVQSRSTAGTLIERMEGAARRIQVPTLIVRGASSELVDKEGVAHLKSLIPHAETVDVEGAHHMVAGDRNDAFNSAVQQFLRKHQNQKH